MTVGYINSYQCVLVTSARDRLPLIFVLQMHDGPSLPFDFKFLFENAFKSILIKSKLINEMINEKQNASKSRNQFGFEYQSEMQILT